MRAERVLAWARRGVLFVVVALLLYGWKRFDVVTLPEGALSPLFGIHAGDRLLVDRRARPAAGESDWLFRAPDGALLLGRAKPPPPDVRLSSGELWIEFERAIPGLQDSRARGPIPSAALAGRVVLVLPR